MGIPPAPPSRSAVDGKQKIQQQQPFAAVCRQGASRATVSGRGHREQQ